MIGQTSSGDISTAGDCAWWISNTTQKHYANVYIFSGKVGQQLAISLNGVGSFGPDLYQYFGNTSDMSDRTAYDDTNEASSYVIHRISASLPAP
jgi:hypothetical protein